MRQSTPDSAAMQLEGSAEASNVMLLLTVGTALALLLAFAALMVCYALSRNLKRMRESARRSQNANLSSELAQALENSPSVPVNLSPENTQMLWSVVREALLASKQSAKFTKSELQTPSDPARFKAANAYQPRQQPPAKSALPRPVPRAVPPATRDAIAPALQAKASPAPVPQQATNSIDTVIARLSQKGAAGMKSMSSRGSFAEFQQQNDVTFYPLDENGEIHVPEGRLTNSQKYLFGLTDPQSGLTALFHGPATREKGQQIAANADREIKRFSTFFEVDRKGDKPALLSPALVRLNGSDIELVKLGRMTL